MAAATSNWLHGTVWEEFSSYVLWCNGLRIPVRKKDQQTLKLSIYLQVSEDNNCRFLTGFLIFPGGRGCNFQQWFLIIQNKNSTGCEKVLPDFWFLWSMLTYFGTLYTFYLVHANDVTFLYSTFTQTCFSFFRELRCAPSPIEQTHQFCRHENMVFVLFHYQHHMLKVLILYCINLFQTHKSI